MKEILILFRRELCAKYSVWQNDSCLAKSKGITKHIFRLSGRNCEILLVVTSCIIKKMSFCDFSRGCVQRQHLRASLPSLSTEVRLGMTLLWYKPYCLLHVNYFLPGIFNNDVFFGQVHKVYDNCIKFYFPFCWLNSIWPQTAFVNR